MKVSEKKPMDDAGFRALHAAFDAFTVLEGYAVHPVDARSLLSRARRVLGQAADRMQYP